MAPTPMAMASPIAPRRDVGVFDDVRRSIEAQLGLRRHRRRQQDGEADRRESQEDFSHAQTPVCCRRFLTERAKSLPVAAMAVNAGTRYS
jgi:hypothetical protein